MSRLAHCVIAFLLLSLSAQAATYYECLVLASTNGGYANLVTPDKATPPVDPYYYAQRADLSSGPYPDRLVAADTNLFDYWFTFPTNRYPGMGVTNVSYIVSDSVIPSSGMTEQGVCWTNDPITCMTFDGATTLLVGGATNNQARFHTDWTLGGLAYVNAWVNPTRTFDTSLNYFLGWSGDNPFFGRFYLGYYTNALRFYCRDVALNATVVDTSAIGHGSNWVMVTATIDATSMHLWTNACLASTVAHNFTTNIASSPTDKDFWVGCGDSGAYFYRGSVGEVVGGTNLSFTTTIITNLWNAGVAKYGGAAK